MALSVSLQAKESWEMDTKEKLEQAAIVKEKGTMYFKVCERGDTRTRAGSRAAGRSEQILDLQRHHLAVPKGCKRQKRAPQPFPVPLPV